MISHIIANSQPPPSLREEIKCWKHVRKGSENLISTRERDREMDIYRERQRVQKRDGKCKRERERKGWGWVGL